MSTWYEKLLKQKPLSASAEKVFRNKYMNEWTNPWNAHRQDLTRYINTTSSSANSFAIIKGVTDGYGDPRLQRKVPDQFPHTLRIVNHTEDYGQADYEEDLEWEIIHHSSCKQELHNVPYIKYEDMRIDEPITIEKVYTCVVGQYIDTTGLDGLSDEHDQEVDWRTLEPGCYDIEVWSSYDSFNREHDGGLRLK